MSTGVAYSVVLILSVGVTANKDSVTPAPKPASTVRGPESLPSESASKLLNWSNATNPTRRVCSRQPVMPHPTCNVPLQRFVFSRFADRRTDSSLGRIANDERRAARVPLLAKRRPWQLLPRREVPVELRPCLGDCDPIVVSASWLVAEATRLRRHMRRRRGGVAMGENVHSAGYVIAGGRAQSFKLATNVSRAGCWQSTHQSRPRRPWTRPESTAGRSGSSSFAGSPRLGGPSSTLFSSPVGLLRLRRALERNQTPTSVSDLGNDEIIF
jgi:hypothetical protein